jgi:hypothetical protein
LFFKLNYPDSNLHLFNIDLTNDAHDDKSCIEKSGENDLIMASVVTIVNLPLTTLTMTRSFSPDFSMLDAGFVIMGVIR